MSELTGFYVHTATVYPFQGASPYGPVYGAAVTVPCFVDAATELVGSTAGAQVSQRTTILYADVQYGPSLVPGSKVVSTQLEDDQTAYVNKLNVLDAGSLPLPAHCEAELK